MDVTLVWARAVTLGVVPSIGTYGKTLAGCSTQIVRREFPEVHYTAVYSSAKVVAMDAHLRGNPENCGVGITRMLHLNLRTDSEHAPSFFSGRLHSPKDRQVEKLPVTVH